MISSNTPTYGIYLLVPSRNEDTFGTELNNIEDWAFRNNLKLNRKKSLEMIVTKKKLIEQPQQVTGIERVSSLDVLGVTIQSDLRMDAHIDKVVKRASSDLYALKILRHHGLSVEPLSLICRATLTAKPA